VDHTLRLIQHNWVVLAYNFNVVILVLIIGESCICAFLLIILLQFYPCCYLALLFYSCTCWVSTINVLNLAISSLLLKPAAQKERMDWNSLTRSSRLRVAPVVVPVVLWSLPLRVVIVFRDTIYVIIILYSWHLFICEHFWPYVWNNWSWVMHTMSTWFWHKNRVWHICTWLLFVVVWFWMCYWFSPWLHSPPIGLSRAGGVYLHSGMHALDFVLVVYWSFY
jgi:hypothetical protein